MSEEKKEHWLSLVALTTVVFAACATLSTFKAGGYSTRSVISQEQASNQWNYFQAKNIRESLYTAQKESLELQTNLLNRAENPDALRKYLEAIARAEAKVEKYRQEKKEIEAQARGFEQARDGAQRNGRPFGIAVIFLQIAILLCSIAGLFKQKPLWLFALGVGAVGLIYFADGFWLFL